MSNATRRVRTRIEFSVQSPAAIAFQIAAAGSANDRLDEHLTVTVDGEPTPTVAEVAMANGGRMHVVESDPGTLRLDYAATVATPIVGPPETAPATVPLDGETFVSLLQSRYCPSDALAGFAAAEFGGALDAPDLAAQVAAWVHRRFQYIPGSSDNFDTAVDTLMKHEGVCRDFAHVTITLCRALGIPARIVAVYAPGITPMDFHAVVEAWVGHRWEIFDPTRLAPRSALVRIATGRDAADTVFATTLRGQVTLTTSHVSAVIDPSLPGDDHAGPVVLA